MQKLFKCPFFIVIFNSLISCESIKQNKMGLLINKSDTKYNVVNNQHAKLIIKRSNDMLYMLLCPKVYINGASVTSLDRNSEYLTEVYPGPITIKVDHWSSPGAYSQTFETKKGCKYFLIVSPRKESIVAAISVGLLIDSIINQNSGLFQISIHDVECDKIT